MSPWSKQPHVHMPYVIQTYALPWPVCFHPDMIADRFRKPSPSGDVRGHAQKRCSHEDTVMSTLLLPSASLLVLELRRVRE